MSHSVLYQWLSKQERLQVKLFFYQTLNEFLNVSAKREYNSLFKNPSRRPGVHGSIFHKSEKPLDELGEIAFDLICKEAGIHRHSAQWYEMQENKEHDEYAIYRAIGKGVALLCTAKASRQAVPLASSYDYEQFAEKFYQKISTFDKSLKIYAYVGKKCLKLQKRLAEMNTAAGPLHTTSNGGFENSHPTLVCSYAFSPQKECGTKIMY